MKRENMVKKIIPCVMLSIPLLSPDISPFARLIGIISIIGLLWIIIASDSNKVE